MPEAEHAGCGAKGAATHPFFTPIETLAKQNRDRYKPGMPDERPDYDGAWKEAFDLYLPQIMELCFPAVAVAIDWAAGVEFLDQELQEIVRDAELGKQRADKLARVRLRTGEPEMIVLHAEIEGKAREAFRQRVYRYNYCIGERYGLPVLSVAILADDRPGWRPDRYERKLLGSVLSFRFPVCKLLDFAKDWDALLASANPAAVIVAAHLRAVETRGDMALREKWKWELTRRLYERGYEKKQVLELFRLIDWLITLPANLNLSFKRRVVEFEKQIAMPHLTSIEELALEEGMEKGMERGMERGMEKGLLIGRIQMLEEMLGRVAPARESLAAKSPVELQAMEAALRTELASR